MAGRAPFRGPAGVTAEIAGYIAKASFDKLPPEVVQQAKNIALDTFGCMLAGSRLKPGGLVIDLVKGFGEKPEATVVGGDFKTSCVNAAFANGTLAHADEVDDAHPASLTHPATTVVPAALVISEWRGLSGKKFLNAIVLGYDIQCRIAIAMVPNHLRERGFWTMSLCGGFGAAVAAAKLLELEPEQVEDALGFASAQMSGLMGCLNEPDHYAKALEQGFPARNGSTAALLAQKGFHGPPNIFEGPYNIFDAYCVQSKRQELARELGSRYEITLTSIKKWACGGPIRGPVDGLLQLMAEHNLHAEDIAEITVTIAPGGVRIVNDRPDLSINLQYVVAVAAYDRWVGFEQTYSESRPKDPKVQELKSRVKLVADPELEEVFPAERPSIVEIVLKDGRKLKTRVDYWKGSPQNPLTPQEVEEKFTRLAAPAVGEGRCLEIINLVRKLDELGSTAALAELLRA